MNARPVDRVRVARTEESANLVLVNPLLYTEAGQHRTTPFSIRAPKDHRTNDIELYQNYRSSYGLYVKDVMISNRYIAH